MCGVRAEREDVWAEVAVRVCEEVLVRSIFPKNLTFVLECMGLPHAHVNMRGFVATKMANL